MQCVLDIKIHFGQSVYFEISYKSMVDNHVQIGWSHDKMLLQLGEEF